MKIIYEKIWYFNFFRDIYYDFTWIKVCTNTAAGVLKVFYYAKRPTPSWRTCDEIGSCGPLNLRVPNATRCASSLSERSKSNRSPGRFCGRVGPAKRAVDACLRTESPTVATRHPINSISTARPRLDPHLGTLALAPAPAPAPLLTSALSVLSRHFLPSPSLSSLFR